MDLVCRDAASKARLLEAAKSLGFEVFGPEKRHSRLGLVFSFQNNIAIFLYQDPNLISCHL
jgi:hypothetical protein